MHKSPGNLYQRLVLMAVIGWVMTSPFRNVETPVFSESGSPSKYRK
jgi:hypothetical protein